MKYLYVSNRQLWRKWLKNNHNKEKEIWLVYYKKHTEKPSISYDDSVEEALSFGWIDSIIKRIDDKKYARKFTPRTNTTKWSEENKERVRKLIKQGRMSKIGLNKIDAKTLNKKELSPMQQLKENFAVPKYLKQALIKNKKARNNFNGLAPFYKRMYIGWIDSAKKEETRAKRIKEAMELLAQGKKLGLK
jgi:uncharacterized protein YdeI (YjbR/CyaY-like superfamily)